MSTHLFSGDTGRCRIGDFELGDFFDVLAFDVAGTSLLHFLRDDAAQTDRVEDAVLSPRIRYVWDIFPAVTERIARMGPSVHATAIIEDGVEISGNVVIGEGVRILSGARLKGDIYVGAGSFIANNALLRGTVSLGPDSGVAFSTDIKDVIAGGGTGFGPLNFFGNSIVGSNCFFGGVVRVSNFRLDGRNVEVRIGGATVDTGRRQFGCIIGDHVSMGVGCTILPGRMIEANTTFGPSVIVNKNSPGGKRYHVRQELVVEG
ncbi:MAG: hypothetical protein JXI32_08925 [Deltaproteobacteria bacterium]|nr:hypothetical protein [Deltaproteobacteria bacterium]